LRELRPVKEITREYSACAIECAYSIDEDIYELNLFLVVTVEQLAQQAKLKVGGLPAGILVHIA
jgi:hypothetical protein